MSKLSLAERAVARCLKRFKPAQGAIARRNARRAFHGALRQLRNAVDAEFPIPAKLRELPSQTTWAWRRRRTNQGYVIVDEYSTSPRLLFCRETKTNFYRDPVDGVAYWVPRWITACTSSWQAKKAKRDLAYRKALLAELALKTRAGDGL